MSHDVGVLTEEGLLAFLNHIGSFTEGKVKLLQFRASVESSISELTGAARLWYTKNGNTLYIEGEREGYRKDIPKPPNIVTEHKHASGCFKLVHEHVRYIVTVTGSSTLILARGETDFDSWSNASRWHSLYGVENSPLDENIIRRLNIFFRLVGAIQTAFRTMNIPDDCISRSGSGVTANSLPWEERGALTISVSFDIRSSTFLMDNASSLAQHARWLHALTDSMRRIILAGGGYFDKFTGDGVLAHFYTGIGEDAVFESSSEVKIDQSCRRALIVSWRLLSLFNLLKPMLSRNQSCAKRGVGGAVALALGSATWQRRGGVLIVVGPGVVRACRASSGDAGSIYCTDSIYERVKSLNLVARRSRFISKEIPDSAFVKLWRIRVGTLAGLGDDDGVLSELANRAWERAGRISGASDVRV